MEDQMSDLESIDLYCKEAKSIVAQSEDIVRRLRTNNVCEGHNLMAYQCMVALRRLSRLIEKHRDRVASEAVSHTADLPAPIPRHWWLAISLRPRGRARAFEART